MTEHLTTPEGRRIAFNRVSGAGPCVVFLGGFRSDMTGTKALALAAWAEERGQAFLRFDYSGHGQSSGAFMDGCLSDWLADARAVLAALTDAPPVLVGSSMGGWLTLLLAREAPEQIAALVTIAAAPDFTRAIMASLDATQREQMARDGHVRRPSAYGDDDIFTQGLIADGEANLVLTRPLALPMPVRMLQGTGDTDVPPDVAMRLLNHLTGPDIQLTLVKGADHRFSTPDCLELMTSAVADVLRRGGHRA